MRKLSLFVGLTLFALAGSARAQDEAPAVAPAAESTPSAEAAPAPAAAAAPESKMQIGVAFLPMLMGKMGAGPSGDDTWSDLKLAYGVGLSFSYNVIAGLSVGIAPQALFAVKPKDGGGDAITEYDIMARIAYAYSVIPALAVYAEALPGYSILSLPDSLTMMGEKPDSPKGFVVGFGAGAAYDITDQFFANVGVGYQMAFQKTKTPGENEDYDMRTKFLRIAVGGGMKF